MRTALATVALLLAAPVAACGPDGAADLARDPAGSGSTPQPAMPTQVPAAPGSVHTRGLVTVMDTGDDPGRPELCLGPVAESWPPQCGGPVIAGWRWSSYDGMFESLGGTRWGEFAVVGTWDGTTLTLEGAIPSPIFDPAMVEEPRWTPPETRLPDAELQRIAEQVGRLPGAQGAYVHRGRVLVDVTYDDGSLQAWADRTYGEDIVVVTSMLLDEQP